MNKQIAPEKIFVDWDDVIETKDGKDYTYCLTYDDGGMAEYHRAPAITAAQQRIKELENALTAANMALEKADGEHWKHLHRIKGLLAILKRLIDGGTTNEKELQAALTAYQEENDAQT